MGGGGSFKMGRGYLKIVKTNKQKCKKYDNILPQLNLLFQNFLNLYSKTCICREVVLQISKIRRKHSLYVFLNENL